ncbi:TonB-dependent receptor [Sandaracinobacteroides saxicola]|uniref:TonB-dependent receptor n=1 Tax=Sandaracinobacteroides saxicola TaxID=2759707 RepID=A0A7G5ILF7_9SPHN|nr:TonB-dependent receptor [Sandaracinobacteroides saxicola]QMW24199.1 TonB-dependent receptor [Sandaracinobacteroides saxicola]
MMLMGRLSLIPLLLAGAAHAPLAAQNAGAADDETIVVTGSRIRRTVNTDANPVTTLGQAEFQDKGLVQAEDLLRSIPGNRSSFNSPNTTGSPYTVGTAQVNLRGLGLSSTLTLINGRRQVVSPIPTDDGSSFVDINTIPLIMVERLEVLQDGAAALYGSDAIAGVANFIMRRKMNGLEARAGYQTTTTNGQGDFTAGLVGGTSFGTVDIVAGVEYLKRTPLAMADRGFTSGKIRSALGFPGAFQQPGRPLPTIDPNCAAAGGIPTVIVPAANLGFCSQDLTNNFDIISPEERVTAYATLNADLGSATLYGEIGFADNSAKVRSSNFSNLKFPTVPATNPGNLVANGGFGVPIVYYGRPLGNQGDVNQRRKSEMLRLVGGIRGDVGGNWNYDVSYAYSQQRFNVDGVTDTKADRFNAALNCQGGPQNNLCFNPFGSSVTNPALANSQAVIDDIRADSFRRYFARMHSVEAVVTGTLFELPAGPVGIAIGGQYRRESLRFASDRDAQTGNLVFIFTGPDFQTSRSIYAGFGELAVPLARGLDLQLAARYEKYSGGGGDSFDPKASLRWEAAPWLTLRGSIGTSFRAPYLSQTTTITTINESISDPLNPAPIGFFRAVVTVPAPLKPESATNYNLGIIFNPVPRLRLSVDYWRYDYRDIIVKQNAQALVTANPRDPRIIRPLGPTGPIAQILVSFENRRAVLTDGFDIAASLDNDLGGGVDLNLLLRANYINQYRTDIGQGEQDLAGLRNFQNFARALPRWRGNLTGTLGFGSSKLITTVNYIDSYRENVLPASSPVNGFKIGAVATVDVQYSVDIGKWNTNLAIGGTNIFGKKPPAVAAPGDLQGFDRLTHDPRGALVYARLVQKF